MNYMECGNNCMMRIFQGNVLLNLSEMYSLSEAKANYTAILLLPSFLDGVPTCSLSYM